MKIYILSFTLLLSACVSEQVPQKALDIAAPVATSIGVSDSDGTYTFGQTLTVTVTFSEPVYVTGTPQISLNSGGKAVYSSGSGGEVLKFTYTIASGESSSDLDYTSRSPFVLTNGSIKDVSGKDATLVFATPGAKGSIANTKSIVIDGVIPSITNITSSSTSNGSYKASTNIQLEVTFNDTVKVNTTSGTPSITLNSGGSATYLSGSNSDTLVFSYTVAAGENSTDLEVSSFSLNNGTIKDSSGNDVDLTPKKSGSVGALSTNKDIIIDTTNPTVSSVTITDNDGTYSTTSPALSIVVTFSESVTVSGTPTLTLNSGGSASYSSDV